MHRHTQAHPQNVLAIVDFNSKPLAPVSPEKNDGEKNEVNENDIKRPFVSVVLLKRRLFEFYLLGQQVPSDLAGRLLEKLRETSR